MDGSGHLLSNCLCGLGAQEWKKIHYILVMLWGRRILSGTVLIHYICTIFWIIIFHNWTNYLKSHVPAPTSIFIKTSEHKFELWWQQHTIFRNMMNDHQQVDTIDVSNINGRLRIWWLYHCSRYYVLYLSIVDDYCYFGLFKSSIFLTEIRAQEVVSVTDTSS